MVRHRNEADTRAAFIDPMLRAAGWETEPHLVKREARLADGRILPDGRRGDVKAADYLLCLRPGFSVAVIEAKAETLPASEGVGQAIEYADRIGVRFAYASNGHEIIERDFRTGVQQSVTTIPTPAELWERLKVSEGLTEERAASLLTPEYASKRELRYYQERAVNTVLRSFALGRTRVLLTMATGTGKTEVAFQINGPT